MNKFLFPIKGQPLTEKRLEGAISYLANLIIAYDFEYITHHVPDVREIVPYLEHYIRRALTQDEWREKLIHYFEDLRNISKPDSEHYQVYDACIVLINDVKDIYDVEKKTEER